MVANFLDLTLSWQRRPFAFSNDGRKLWATVLFLSAIMYRKVIHVNVLRFFCHICRTTVCWDPQISLPWQREVTTSLLYYAISWCEVWNQKIFGASHISYNSYNMAYYSASDRIFREFSEWQNLSSVSASTQLTALRWKSPLWVSCKPEFDFPVAIALVVP